MGRSPKITTIAAFAAIAAVLTLLLAVRWHDAPPYAGDEPHYLVVTNSLILDGDVDVKNDYLDERYFKYTHSWIDPHVNTHMFTLESRHWYSQHGVGLPALLVPAVVVDDANGAAAAMVLVATLVLLLAFLWVKRFTTDLRLALVATGALALSPFFLELEGRIFPDLVTAALLLGCLLILEMRAPQRRHLLLLSALVAVSPWFHFKNALAFAAVVAIAVVKVTRSSAAGERMRSLLLVVGPVLVSALGYELAVHSWYASWLPTAMFPPGNHVFALNPARGIAAASFDSARGLFATDPALMLILAGLPLWLRRWPGPFLRLGLVLGPTILVQATFNDWSGGYAPAARYALQFTPALLPAVALLLQEASRAFRSLAAVLLGLEGVLAAAFVWFHPGWGFTGSRSPLLAAVDGKLGFTLDRAMPTFNSRAALIRGEWQLAAWLLAAGALIAYGARLSRRPIMAPALIELEPSTSGRS